MSNLIPKSEYNDCIFCGGRRKYIYTLNGREIVQCEVCRTSGVFDMPSSDELAEYYQGFAYANDVRRLNALTHPQMRAWMKSHLPKSTGRMLDLGGGGGLFAKAFEVMGLGEGVVVDLDRESCEFARDKLGLKNVFQLSLESDDISNIGEFDFVYCRHVIEHLIDPCAFILKSLKLVRSGGYFVIQCPNGLSKEQALFYPDRWAKYLRSVKRFNEWGKVYSILCSLSGEYGFGLDPLRHLWAISQKGLYDLTDCLDGYSTSFNTASLADPVFSPYYRSYSRLGRLRDRIARYAVSLGLPGCHLIATIRRN